MTPDRFSECLDQLGWSQRHLSALLGCDTNLPTRWSRGDALIPPSIGSWLEALITAYSVHQPPEDWRVR